MLETAEGGAEEDRVADNIEDEVPPMMDTIGYGAAGLAGIMHTQPSNTLAMSVAHKEWHPDNTGTNRANEVLGLGGRERVDPATVCYNGGPRSTGPMHSVAPHVASAICGKFQKPSEVNPARSVLTCRPMLPPRCVCPDRHTKAVREGRGANGAASHTLSLPASRVSWRRIRRSS